MKIVIQRVTQASVTIAGQIHAAIKTGLLVLVGVEDADTDDDVQWLSQKLVQLRIFNDEAAIPNLSVKDVGGDVIIVSQFTLHAATKKGNRPSYIKAAKPPLAATLYEAFVAAVTQQLGKPVGTGVFGADMQLALVNDGPLTIIIDSKNKI
ncbi:D-aminoacyl-tRNA deacylase [Ferruginibacter yonginensis]|uniref:D-aminoacyl-tRNA deacylase n=1 Tax=Ferruginibacter yonginensis TaxID=1310416 RepID=A0ABV8QUC7_9BACT